MSVILDLSIFPMDQGASVSAFVAPVIAMIRESGFACHLSPMGTAVETESLAEALELIAQSQSLLDAMGCERVYAVAKFDIRSGPPGRLLGKLDSIQARIGEGGALAARYSRPESGGRPGGGLPGAPS